MIVREKIKKKNTFLKSGRAFNKRLFIESYGCQMNFSDSEIVASILKKEGYSITDNFIGSDLILLNTCSIREKAELTVRNRLKVFDAYKKQNPSVKVGVLGCMAERLKQKFLEEEKIVDLVVGPDAYKDLPNLLKEVSMGRNAVNVLLSKEETYGDISPVRLGKDKISSFVSIMRGCDNMCSFCVVPFTRGRERSRDPKSILSEIRELNKKGFKEVTLLGQNVDSYLWYGSGLKKDFKKASDIQKRTAINFAKLLALVASENTTMRIRFSTSNPQDMTLDVLHTMSNYPNICRHIHLPVQSGSNRILKKMNRLHTIEEYIRLIDTIRSIIPDCGISHDIIAGFPTETEKDHRATLDLMEYVKYDFGFMFAYSERPGTFASKNMEDDVSLEKKKQRLKEIIALQQQHSHYRTQSFIGKKICVLIEKRSKKSDAYWMGRTSQNTVVVFPKEHYLVGDFVDVAIKDCTSTTLLGSALGFCKNS